MKNPLALIVIIVGCIILGAAGAGVYLLFVNFVNPDADIKEAVEAAVDQWAAQYQYRDTEIELKILERRDRYVRAAVFIYVQDAQLHWYPVETVMDLQRFTNEWTTQPLGFLETPFEVTILTASESSQWKCVDVAQRTPSEYPCLRIKNKGNFDWEWSSIWLAGNNWNCGTSCNYIEIEANSELDYVHNLMTWEGLGEIYPNLEFLVAKDDPLSNEMKILRMAIFPVQ